MADREVRRPHIVFVAQQTANRSNGGLESATQIFEALRDDFRWTFVTNRRSAFTRRWSEGGARIAIVPADTTAEGPRQALAAMRLALRLAWISWRDRPDVLHANDSRSMAALLALPRFLRPGMLFTVRGTQRPDKVYGGHWRRAAALFDRIVVLSREMAETLGPRIGAAPGRFAVIESIVDLARFRPRSAREGRGRDGAEIAIGAVGVVAENKGQLELIEHAAPLLRAASPGCSLDFYGDHDPAKSEYSRRCAAAVDRHGLEHRVVFHGHVADVASAVREMDIAAIPSEREGLSRAMIEAMAAGVPVVSFGVCSAREMLDETGAGIVVAEGDFAALVLSIAELAGDAARRRSMGEAGRAVAEQRFGVAKARQAWLDLYREVAESAREKKVRK